MTRRSFSESATAALFASGGLHGAPPAKIILIAGTQSHNPGSHEYEAGCHVLQGFLAQNQVADAVVVNGGWPSNEEIFNGARAVVLYMDGGDAHSLLVGNRLSTIGRPMRAGVGLACLHYAVEVPKHRAGEQFLEWLGGHYERPYSQNPINELELARAVPNHPISRGWSSFRLRDEWYYRIRFQENDRRVSPILTARIPAVTEAPETLAWATEREHGGRGFGFTGLHKHRNWTHPNFRRLLVNSVLWTANLRVPEAGALCALAPEDLDKHLFTPKPPK